MHARTEHGAWNNDVLFKLDEITNTVCRFIKFYFSIFNNKIIVLERAEHARTHARRTEHGARSTEHGACTHDARSMEHGARSMHTRTHDARSTEHGIMMFYSNSMK